LSSEDKSALERRLTLTSSHGKFAAPGRLPALALLALLVIVRAIDPGVVQSLRLRGFDFVEQFAPRKYQPLPVEIVAIDDKSLAQYGQWPWSRARVAQLVDKIAAGKPSVLGVDIIFAEPDRLSPGRLVDSDPEIPAEVASELARLPSHESALGDAFRNVPTVLAVGVSDEAPHAAPAPMRFTTILESGANPRPFLFTHPKLIRSLPEIASAERGQGSIDSETDRDGITRRVPLFIVVEGRLIPNLALEMLRVASGAGAIGIVTGKEGVEGATLGGNFLPTDRRGRIYPYFTPSYDARYISAADLLDGSYDPARLKGAAVLLGSSALGLTDQDQTPRGLMPGIEVWAQTLESMLTGNLLRRPAYLDLIEIAIVLIAGLVIIFVLPYSNPRMAATEFLGIVAILLVLALASFRFSKLLLDGIYPALSSALVFGVMLSENWRAAERQRKRITQAFGHYLSPIIVERLASDWNSLKLGGEAREISVMFADLSGFTAASTHMTPEELTGKVNRYFQYIVQPIDTTLGYVERFVGDAVMGMWGAPLSNEDHAVNAVRAALAIIDGVGRAREEDERRGEPGFMIKVGINSGSAVVGNIGTENRLSYTAMGEQVNLAARLESVPPMYACLIVVGEHTAGLARNVFLMRELDRLLVKGADKAISVYQPIVELDSATDAQRKLVSQFAHALEHYRAGRFADACLIWDELVAEYEPAPSPSSVMSARSRELISNRPEEPWTAVNVLVTK
jgi:adenylate cyclase